MLKWLRSQEGKETRAAGRIFGSKDMSSSQDDLCIDEERTPDKATPWLHRPCIRTGLTTCADRTMTHLMSQQHASPIEEDF